MILSGKFYSFTKEYNTIRDHVAAPMLRKSFTLPRVPEKAEITVTGLGFYVLFVNGKDITKGALAPYISNPDQIIYYDNYDVTPYLTEGENVVGVMLGNGMQDEDTPVWDFVKNPFRSAPKFAIAFEADGKLLFEADGGFKGHASPITFDSLRAGERYDARAEQPGWNAPGFDDSTWGEPFAVPSNKGEKRICAAPPITVYREIKPVSVFKSKANSYIYDFGENNAGTIRLKVKGERGQKLTIKLGEIANFHGVDQANISFDDQTMPGYIQTVEYTLKGGEEEVYVPHFTYFGFRYAEVMWLHPEQASADLLTYLVMSSLMDEVGEFSCSDDTVNRIQANAVRSNHSNFYYFPTDCPHREKNGWTGDAALSAQQFLMNMDVEDSLVEWLRCVCRAQRPDGALPGIIPTAGWGFDWGNGPAWDIALTMLPFMLWRINGNLDCFRECADNIYRYIEYIPSRLDENGLAHYGLGDWCEVDGPGGELTTPLVVTDTLTLVNLTRMATELFAAVGDETRSAACRELHDRLVAAFRKHLMNADHTEVVPLSQAGQAMAMYYGAFTDEEKPAALVGLKKAIERYDGHIQTGVLGARTLFRVLSDMGETELAYRMITRPDYPSFANHVLTGATTLYEIFRKPSEEFPYTSDMFACGSHNARSLNHHFWGDVSGWFYEALGGIRINEALTKHTDVVIDPKFVSALNSVRATHVFKNIGTIAVEWTRENGAITLSVTVPAGLHVVLKPTGKLLPAGTTTVIIK